VRTPLLLLSLALATTLAGCSSPGRTVARSDPSAGLPPSAGSPDAHHAVLPYGPQGPALAGAIPADLAPPVGQCRVWLPGLAPADQPDPALCSRAKANVPLGALLVQTPQPGVVEVTAYDDIHPGLVVMVTRYDVRTGELLGTGEADRRD
jgi:hypothetical protein